MVGAQAASAQVEPFWLTVYIQGNRVNIGQPATVGTVFRVADIMTELG